jgi:hypothetical protein
LVPDLRDKRKHNQKMAKEKENYSYEKGHS